MAIIATYYVDYVNGADANNGLGPDASHGSNKPWKTITKLLGAAGFASGDTAYLSPAGPFREALTVAMTSATVETKIIGDPSNAQGFKTSGGVLVAPGYVTWTGYTTNDTTAPSGTVLLTLAGRDFLTFQNLLIVGSNTFFTTVQGSTTLSTNITFQDCVFISSRTGGTGSLTMNVTTLADTAVHWLIDRCRFFGFTAGLLDVNLPTSASADYDVDVIVQNCIFVGSGNGVRAVPSGAGAFKGGGVIMRNCTLHCATGMITAGANISTSIPCLAYNNLIVGNVGLNANVSGQIVEDYNILFAGTPRTNVSTGANSIATVSSGIAYATMLEFGQAEMWGFATRPYAAPMKGAPHLNFGGTGAPSVDALNRPRPAGSGLGASAGVSVALGPLERHDTAAQETSTVDAGSSGLKIVGPGNHDIRIPVDASATVITIRARYDTTHDTTNKPQAILLANAKIGVTTETQTMTSAADTWETLTFASQTPSAKGVVTVRLVSRSAAGTGIAFFDTVTVA